jgi:TRAP-type C4-dicarboxylate transport system substrate-binding protein
MMKMQKLLALCIGIFFVFFLAFFTVAHAESPAKPIELKFSTWNPAQLPMCKIVEQWGKMVEEKSGGKVKITFYFSGSLVAFKDTYRAIQTGVTDMGDWVLGTIPGIHILNEFTSLPLIGWDNTFTATKVYHEMQKKFPELNAEFEGLKILFSMAMPANQIHMTKKTVRVPDDLRGVKIIGAAGWSDFINTMGATAIFKGPQDYYMSLQKGLVEGAFQHWAVIDGFKLTELFSSHTEAGDAGFGLIMHVFLINQDVWDKFPPEVQKAFMDSKEWVEQEILESDVATVDMARAKAKEMGHDVIQLTPKERKVWVKATEPLREKWIADAEAKGLPGKAVYKEAQRLIKKYSK